MEEHSDENTISRFNELSLTSELNNSVNQENTTTMIERSSTVDYDWQLSKNKLSDRGKYLLETGLWSDAQFTVGIGSLSKVFKCHKMVLAMASPVFEAMFYGGLADNTNDIAILDIQPDAFQVLLEYVYTDEIKLNSFDLVCDVCYAAKKYMLPALVNECTKCLWRDLYPRNACRAYEFAKLFEEPILLEKSLQIIRCQTIEVLNESTFEEIDHQTLCEILSQDTTAAHEAILFDGMLKWAFKECERRNCQTSTENKRECLGDALFLIRYLTFSASEFAAGPAQSGLLNQEECFAILMNISAPGSWPVPNYILDETECRQLPKETNMATENLDSTTKLFCKRAMMEEPHCLNTSILDCSVTFTVDKDICIHGIEVPSQVTDVPADNASLPDGQGFGAQGSTDYNELLYAHLLDSDGNRLTYTHFTAKVSWNSMIEINFNRAIYIEPHKVYRIGMVLNKVGWYPMGVCTRRVNTEGCFFTFCVGQPNDTQRDGLIRSIVFSQ